jgi:peptidoglycan/LPS O-acetylase OafA/YrhL
MRASAFDGILWPVAVIAGIALFVVVASVSTLVIDQWIRRPRRSHLLERLQAYHPTSVADEAQRWLEEQHGW